MRHLATSRAAAGTLLAVTALVALCTAQYTFGLSDTLAAVFNTGGYDALMIVAGAMCVARGIARPRDRAAWILMGAAVAAWGIGDTIWTFTVMDDPHAPYPSAADAFYLAVYPCAHAAIFLLLRSRVGSLRGSLWLDGVIGGLAVASLGTAVVFEAVLRATGGSPAAVATNLAYPLADLTLIALVVWALAMAGWRPGRTWGLLAAGLLVFSISDCLYLYETSVGSYVVGTVTDVGWLAGGALLAWAAWQPDERRAAVRMDGHGLLLAPVAFGLLALGVLVYDHFVQVNVLPLAFSSAALFAVIARMALTFAENLAMIRSTHEEARTDVLTGLGNRRKLYDDLDRALARPDAQLVLVLFDLNGFKLYNDSFGHPAGDALLARLGQNLVAFVRGRGGAYRMGGDEFCIVVPYEADEIELVVAGAARALSDRGEGFEVTAAWGSVSLPEEAATAADALRLADQRMYLDKAGSRGSAGEQSTGVLLRALGERYSPLGLHARRVGELAHDVARRLGLSAEDVPRAQTVGALHDIGKVAIPDEILAKPGPLDEVEWEFLRGHPRVGERILLAAPALAHVSSLVRASHEHFDGRGYPDGLAGTEIPFVSRIVFACDAFDSMTSDRPWGEARTIDAAIEELHANAGRQFDPVVVAALAELISERGARRLALAS